ncbi:damage-control phosphatase ARMT1 family protein [Streptomyces sp. PT12]|uniref:damage-control phosphatase ARMT1 family protein n=1 Tax=Streptomyces sp. PT12 TaxID=1510197 RepID=UPI000DE1CB14|nr:damage-control phosphatase ARMT1 family protein [Streptomyces sp. PT12]RBM21928.1 hypothetical protein DEH69_05270 [Streptomyces sp. PT12]
MSVQHPRQPPERPDVPPITGDDPGSFAHGVLATRHPTLIRQVADAFPWPPDRRRGLDALLTEITEGVVEPLPPDAHDDHARWERWGREHIGRTWYAVPFLWAESYFYRRLLGVLGHFDPGPWHGVDPFAPAKGDELGGSAVAAELAALDQLTDRPADTVGPALLHASLWGNRADLGFRIDSGGAHERDGTPEHGDGTPEHGHGTRQRGGGSPLLADDSAALWALLPTGARATAHLIADNSGRELIPDLILIDHLLAAERAETVTLHVKPYPYYVSDATLADVVAALRRLASAQGYAAAAGARLWSAMATGRLTVAAHPFFCAPLPYDAMPDDLRAHLATATVTVLKGDLNYRRLVGDRLWPATTPFTERTAHFPGPLVALRTLKSDVITGLAPHTVAALDATAEPWRTTGTHALIQADTRERRTPRPR